MIQEYESRLIKKNHELSLACCRAITLKKFDAASVGMLLRQLMYGDHKPVSKYLENNRAQAIVLRNMLPRGAFANIVDYHWEDKIVSIIDKNNSIVSNAFAPNRPFLRHRVYDSYTLARYTEWYRSYALVPNIISVFRVHNNLVDISLDNANQLNKVIPLLSQTNRETFAMAVMLHMTMGVFHSQIVNTRKTHQYRLLSPEMVFFSKDGMLRLPIPDDESHDMIVAQSVHILSSPFLAPERRILIEDFLKLQYPINASAMWSIGAIALSIALGMNLDTKNYGMRLMYQKMFDSALSDSYEHSPFYEIIHRCLQYNPYERITPQEALSMMSATNIPVWKMPEPISVETMEYEMSHGKNNFYKGPLEWKNFIDITMQRLKKSQRFIRDIVS